MNGQPNISGSRIRFALAAVAVLAFAGVASAEIKGMPSLDATRPIARPAAPGKPGSGATTLPAFTAAQVDRGRADYLKNCADCHGSELNNGEFGGAPLVGSYFSEHWGDLTVDALFGYLTAAMPPDRPGRLTPQSYADLVAFILDRNGYRPGNQELPPDLAALESMTLAR